MNDSISRQAAIDTLCDNCDHVEAVCPHYPCKQYIAIENPPSVEPGRKWIPCSERLPDMWDERYLVSLAWGGIGVMEYKSTGFHNYGSFTPVPIKSIIAWMPLPEPYKESENG